jgi:hypothetical protein
MPSRDRKGAVRCVRDFGDEHFLQANAIQYLNYRSLAVGGSA